MDRSTISLIFVLGTLCALGPIAIDMYLPALPLLARDLAATDGTIQHTVMAFFLGVTVEHIDAAPDNFRHRMIANGAGFAAALLLALTGIWLAEKMAELRHDQDCVLMRLQSCAAAAPKPLP